jgi:hypothetical protein
MFTNIFFIKFLKCCIETKKSFVAIAKLHQIVQFLNEIKQNQKQNQKQQ